MHHDISVIVPLAGPDYFSNSKPKGLELDDNGSPQLLTTLQSRPWHNLCSQYIFVFIDSSASRKFFSNFIRHHFSNSLAVFLPFSTNGAAFSALTALPFVQSSVAPLIIDLADIFFECAALTSLTELLYTNDFIAPYFESSDPIYSYYETTGSPNHFILKCQEKKVISNIASAGVYIYSNSQVFLEACNSCIFDKSLYYHSLSYVAPLVNGILNLSKFKPTRAIKVDSYRDYKLVK